MKVLSTGKKVIQIAIRRLTITLADGLNAIDAQPRREATRRTRLAIAPCDFAFAWNRGDTSARRPRRKA